MPKIKNFGIYLIFLMIFPGSCSNPELPKPSEAQYKWHEQERIMFVCLDPCSWQGREYDDHSTDLKDMQLPKLNAKPVNPSAAHSEKMIAIASFEG